jgi:hypothetical protein
VQQSPSPSIPLAAFWTRRLPAKASYVSIQGVQAKRTGFVATHYLHDLNYRVITSNTDPEVTWYVPGDWIYRTTGKTWQGRLHLPSHFTLPEARPGWTPNNPTLVLNTDTGAVTPLNAVARPRKNGPLWAYKAQGSHAGSGLSGGEILASELRAKVIPHALAINVYAHQYLSPSHGGYRWPASKADGYALTAGHPLQYAGQQPDLRMGSWVGIPKTVTAQQLGLTTPPSLMLLAALQQFGAYVVDDSAWDSVSLNVDPAAATLLNENQPEVVADIHRLFQALWLVKPSLNQN